MPSAIDLSSFAGLTAMALLAINLLLGLLVTTNYNPRQHWPHRKIPIFKIHNWNAYLAIAVVCLHPVILLFSKTAGFHARDVLWPLHSPGQRLYNCMGAAAFYAIALVVVTSYFRPRLGSRPWEEAALLRLPGRRTALRPRHVDRPQPQESAHRFSGRRKGVRGKLLCSGSCGVRMAVALRQGTPTSLRRETQDREGCLKRLWPGRTI
jgi:hypothetical protein